MDKRVSITGACVFPVALVEDVVGEDAKAHPALLATGRIARSEVEEVIAADAHRVIPSSFFATGIAPARQQMKVGKVQRADSRYGDIRKEGSLQARLIDHLFAIE